MKKTIISAVWIILGTTLLLCGMMGIMDSYWSGMGGGLLGVGIAQTIRNIRYHKDASYRETVDIQNKDERNKYLSGRAWAWAGYLYVMLNGAGVVLLKIAGYDTLSLWAAYSVCIILILYWLSYLVLQKKY